VGRFAPDKGEIHMGIDVKKMQAKLNALQNKGGGSKTAFWSPK
jgi:hypothetical protein